MTDVLVITEVATEIVEIPNAVTEVLEITATAVEVIEVGTQGPPGPPGPSGLVNNALAGATLSGHRAVKFDGQSRLVYVDGTDVADIGKVIGVTTGAAVAGDVGYYQGAGEHIEPTWNWTPGLPVFFGAAGVLTQTPPTSGFMQVVGRAVTPTKLFLRIEPALALALE